MTAPAGGYMTPPAPQQPVDQFGRPYQGAPQQQNGQQPAPQNFQQQAPPQGMDLNARIPATQEFPRELHGKTWAEALRYYQVMREDFINRNRPQGQPAPQQQAPQGQQAPRNQFGQPTQQNGQPAPQQAQPQDQGQQQPMQQMIQEAVRQALGPVQQVSTSTVYEQVARRFPDWNQYAEEIQHSLVGADPQQLMNPATWETAYYFVRGRRSVQGQQGAPAYQQPQAEPRPQAAAWQNGQPVDSAGRPVQMGQPQQQYQPQPPQQQAPYFVESPTPTPPAPGGQYGAAPQDEYWAKKFGMPVEEYRAYKGGNVPPMNAPQQPVQQWGQQPPYGQTPFQQQQPYPQQQPNNGGFRGY